MQDSPKPAWVQIATAPTDTVAETGEKVVAAVIFESDHLVSSSVNLSVPIATRSLTKEIEEPHGTFASPQNHRTR